MLGQRGEEITQLQLEIMTLKEEAASLSQENAIKNN
jgi:FtsZ-binding cell division protein ZapB